MIRKNGTVSVKQIYKIQAFVIRKKRGTWEDLYRKEFVVIANPDYARLKYKECLDHIEYEMQFSKKKKCGCYLYVPHIHENGELAYWPDDEKYIEKFEKET